MPLLYTLILFALTLGLPALSTPWDENCRRLIGTSSIAEVSAFPFQNSQLQSRLTEGLDRQSLVAVARFLLDEGGFSIPTREGFVAAAEVGNHPGNYGRYFWLRDMARVYQGKRHYVGLLKKLSSPKYEEARRELQVMTGALVKVIEDPHFRLQAQALVEHPPRHLDEEHGYKNVIWIRRLLDPFIENRESTEEELRIESHWGHKQNDALAAFGHAVLDALEQGLLNSEDMSVDFHSNFSLLPLYFVRLEYWKMWDVGAWEEKLALRTSSIGLVASFLQRIKNHPQWISPLLTQDELNHAIQEGARQVLTALEGPFEAPRGEEHATRREDAALLHLLWYPLEELSWQRQVQLVDSLSVLERSGGYIRYEADWFLYGAAEAARNAEALGVKVALPEGGSVARLLDFYDLHSRDKNMWPVMEAGGFGLEAQWTLTDSDLTYFFADLYIKTRKEIYLTRARYHAVRMFSQVTGENTQSSEGQVMAPVRFPEAFIPMNILVHGRVERIYRASPNSPLNWATANAIRAVDKLLEAFQTGG